MSPSSGGRPGLHGLGWTVLFGLVVGCSVPASTRAAGPPDATVVANRSAERGATDAERRQAATPYDPAKADCQGRFMLTQCLGDARNARRLALNNLQRRQRTLNEAARRERSAKRLQIMQTPARPMAVAASSQALRNQAAYLQRQQQADAHRDAVLARNARMDASKSPAAGLPVYAAAPASH